MELKRIINLVNEIQIASHGEVDPSGDPVEYVADVNVRIGEMEKGIALLKHELSRQGLNDW